MSGRKTCYYEILGIEKTATEKEIKLAYRRLALKWHPDKNADNEEEARKMFQLINEANETLSDPQERAWYDDHRDQVLGGDQEEGFGLNLSEYFSRSAFEGFDDSPRGFYAVFRDLFANIFSNESEYRTGNLPMFGKSTTSHNEISSFYLSWSNFATAHPFTYADEYKVERDYNRYQRRQIEAHNLDKRKDAKKKYNLEVRAVVDYVKRRDPRWAAFEVEKKRQADAKAEEADRKKREKEEKDAEKRKVYAEEARKEAEARKAEMKRAIQEARMTGQVFDADDLDADGVDSDEDGGVIVLCEVCKKVFKSKPQFDAHCKSKKHLQVVAQLKKEFERQNRVAAKHQSKKAVVESDSEDDSEDDSDVEETSSVGSDQDLEDEDDVSESSEEEDLPPAHLNKKQKKAWLDQRRRQQELNAKLGASSKKKSKQESSEEESDDDEVLEGSSASESEEDLAKEVAAQLAALKMGANKTAAKAKAKKGKSAIVEVSSSSESEEDSEVSSSEGDSSEDQSSDDGSSSDDEESSEDDGVPLVLPQGRRAARQGAAKDEDDDWQSGGAKKGKAKAKAKQQPSTVPTKQEAKTAKKGADDEEEEYTIIGMPTAGGAQKKSKKTKKTQDEELPEWRCAVCQGVFDTRNKLFTHIKEKNHVAFKSADGSLEAPKPKASKKGARK